MSLNKGYSVHAEITSTVNDIQENENAYRITKNAQRFLTIATTLIYYSFTSVIFAGVSVWAFQDYVFGNATNVNGLLFTVALVISTPIGLALAKHSNFQAMARAIDFRSFIIRALIMLAILTGIWYEAISSSSNLQEKAFHSVENSKSGASIMGTQINNTASTGYAELIAKAAQSHEQCLVKLEAAKKANPDTKFHCNGDKSKLESLKSQASAERESVSKANVDAIAAKQAALNAERDAHVLPAAKAIAGWFNTPLAAGTFIIVLISSLFFELIHLSTVYSERNNLIQRNNLNRHLQALKNEYFNLVSKIYSAEDFKDEKILDMQELRDSGAINDFKSGVPDNRFETDDYKITTKGTPYKGDKTGFGFVPSPANARFKWQDSEIELPAKPERKFGFIPSRSSESLDAENRRKYPQTILSTKCDRPTQDDWHLTPRIDRKHPTPQADDKPVNSANIQPPTGDCIQATVESAGTSTHALETAYMHAQTVKVKHECNCPVCGEVFIKSNAQHLFCSNNRNKAKHGGKDCSTKYWAMMKPERQQFALKHKR
jgi:hypothetical protein